MSFVDCLNWTSPAESQKEVFAALLLRNPLSTLQAYDLRHENWSYCLRSPTIVKWPARSWHTEQWSDSWGSNFSSRDADHKLVAWKVGFVAAMQRKLPSATPLVMFSSNNQRNSLRVSWEVRKSLYAYMICKHNDLRTCKKVGKFWSTVKGLDFEVC